MPVFLLPDLGEGLTEAEIVTWLVEEGQTVVVDQPIVEVETAKATVEVPVPFAGVVTKRHGAAGSVLTVGSPLVEVGAASEIDAPVPTPPTDPRPGQRGFREPGAVTPDPPDGAAAAEESSGNVLIGYGTSAAPRRRRSGRRAGRPVNAEPAAPPGPGAPEPTTAVAVISPIVRRLARLEGIDLRQVPGTGRGGTITRQDLKDALAARAAGSAATPAEQPVVEPADAPIRTDAGEPGTDERRIRLRGVRKAVADKLSRSRREIPEATVWVDVDATELLAARRTLNGYEPDRPVSLLSLVARFAVLGLGRFPELNGRVEGEEIVLSDAVHLGFAAQTDRGLVVPVVRNAHRMSTRDLSDALEERTAQGRTGRLAPADLTGGTFTVNNYGVFGVDGSAAIINHPEVAILGIGRIIDRPWVVDGELAVRSVTQLTLAFDHRVCDGGTAGGFLRFVADCVESPIRALAEF
ncbi:dihydrolipoamide acetyltransferase family protein [Geodermatophilus ruber]|uniref:Dihydrolipoamide acetyltransferase component of pyruvate dehydrogenase complex n=1 Tax=Geodermatophilus ruber TaxID=504800 RepID=A0A1I4GJH1_9ACTN|nr:dihydrolipoamide acetyltransferase family protein [Geodermatophilus ruber]SFL30115.1 pyruvate dehydrogenase E2 component (dihydrolipoamide acetyltransferase) [Geodermatophilus ruber]